MAEIIPAILTDSMPELEAKLRVLEGWAPRVHIDICDGQFVPSRSVQLGDVLQVVTNLTFEIHLMVQDPRAALEQLANYPVVRPIIHLETLAPSGWQAITHPEKTLAIRPETPIDRISAYDPIKRILSLEVRPGYQGGGLVDDAFTRITAIRQLVPTATLCADGHVNQETIKELVAHGAQELVVGSALWEANDPLAAYQGLVDLIR